MNDFWENLFSNLGFEKTTILGRPAFKIPIYEAIYMSQVLGPAETTDFNMWWRTPFRVAIPTKDNRVLCFPNPCPSVRVGEIFLGKSSMDLLLNPMLSPSLNFIKKEAPEFFNSGMKYLLLEDDSTLLEQIKAGGLNPTDFVLLRVGYYERGIYRGGLPLKYMDESIMEYVTSAFLRGKGFIVDKFNEQLTMGPGQPDLFAVKILELQNRLTDLKVTNGGFYLAELELLETLGEKSGGLRIGESKSIVIEVESPTDSGRFSKGRQQVLEYLNHGCYNEAYVAIPFEEDRARTLGGRPEELGFEPFEDVGIVTLSKDGKIIFRGCLREYGQQEKIKELLKNVERIVKLSLLKNLPLRRVLDLLPEVQSFYDLYFAVDKLEIDKIISPIKQSLQL